MSKEQKLDGAALSSSTMMAMMELLNGGPEIGRLPRDHHALVAARAMYENNKKIGRVFVFSTVADMDKNDNAKLLWQTPDL